MSHDGGFAPIAVVVQQLLLCVDVSGGHQDQMRGSIDGVKLCLAVAGFTVVDQSSKTARFLCSVHTVGGQRIKIKLSRQASTLEVIAPKDILFSPITTANIMTPGGHFPLKRLLITTPPWLGLNLKKTTFICIFIPKIIIVKILWQLFVDSLKRHWQGVLGVGELHDAAKVPQTQSHFVKYLCTFFHPKKSVWLCSYL